jgi:hypothetical protein
MLKLDEIKKQVQEIQDLIEFFENKTKKNSFLNDFKKHLDALNITLASYGSSSVELKSVNQARREILKGVELAILSSLIERLSAELTFNPNKKINKFKSSLEEIKSTFESSTEKMSINIEFITQAINDLVLLTETPPARLSVDISTPVLTKKKKKPRLVKIKDMPDIIGDLRKKHEKCLEEKETQTKTLGTLEKRFDTLRRQDEVKDPLISHLQDKVQASKHEFAQVFKINEGLKKELDFLCSACSGFFDPKAQGLELQKKKISEFYTFLKERGLKVGTKVEIIKAVSVSTKSNSNELQDWEVEFIREQISSLRKKYNYQSIHQLNETLFTADQNFLRAQSQYIEDINNATALILQRLDELEQKKGKVTASTETDRGLVKLDAKLEELKLKVNGIIDELKQQTPAETEVTNEERDSVILAIVKEIKTISDERRNLVRARNENFKVLNAEEAFLDTPLEADRLIKKIAGTRQLFENLVEKRVQHNRLLTKLKDAQTQRTSSAIEASSTLNKAIDNVAQMIKDIQENLVPFFSDEMLKDSIDKVRVLKEKMGKDMEKIPVTMSKDDIAILRQEGLKIIQGVKAKLKQKLRYINIRYIEEIEAAFDLRKLVQTHLPEHIQHQFKDVFSLANKYENLSKRAMDKVLPVKLNDSHHEIISQSRELFQNITAEIKARTEHPLAFIVRNMLILVDEELARTQSPPKKAILNELKQGLETDLTDFTQLVINPQDAIPKFTITLMKKLSQDKLRTLSDVDKSSFVVFIRKLLEPFITFITKVTGEKYRHNFFASVTEKNIAKAAQAFYSNLQAEAENINPRKPK